MTPATLDPLKTDFASGASRAPATVAKTWNTGPTVRERLDQLVLLSYGWDGDDAHAIDPFAVRMAWTLAEQALRAGFPEPEVFPVPDGGVQLEWHAGPVELEVEIEPGGRGIVFVCDDEQAGQRIDGELPRDESRFGLALARLHAYA